MVVKFHHIFKNFGPVKALTDVSLTAHSGSIHGLIGENGAGKSTLMKILTGYQTKSSGTILIDEQEIKLDNPRQSSLHGIGMLYQEPMDFTPLTVLENFSLGSPYQNCHTSRLTLRNLCSRFGFHLDPDRTVEQLTVGERQQIELLRLIHIKTRILILDEPTTGISPAQKEVLFPALKQLAADGMIILLVSHKLEEVATLCNEVTVLRQGSVTHHAMAPFTFPELLTAMFGSVPERKDKEAPRERGEQIFTFQNIIAAGERQGLSQCNISVAEGEVIGLAGLDGAGQSTFLRLAAGLTIPEKGKVRLFTDTLPKSSHACRMAQELKTAFIPADRLEEALFSDISLSDHFSLQSKETSFWQSKEKSKMLAAKAIAEFYIKGQADDTANDLSGGNQQRLLLALLDPQARLLLLEDPTRGLDIRSGQWVWQYLKHGFSPKTTIVFSSPELDEILHYSDRIIVFYDGEIVMDKAVNNTNHDAIAAAMTGIKEAA